MTEISSKTIRVFLVDDHPLVRMGLRTLLAIEEDIDVVGEAATVNEAVNEIRKTQPDIVLLDVRLKDESGFEVFRELKADGLKTRFIVLTSSIDQDWVFTAITEGLDGYLVKELSNTELLTAIRTVNQGQPMIDPAATDSLFRKIREDAKPSPARLLNLLSPQEGRVLAKVAEGMTNKEIAASLNLSEKTIKNYFSNILEKLGMTRRAEAAAFYAKYAD